MWWILRQPTIGMIASINSTVQSSLLVQADEKDSYPNLPVLLIFNERTHCYCSIHIAIAYSRVRLHKQKWIIDKWHFEHLLVEHIVHSDRAHLQHVWAQAHGPNLTYHWMKRMKKWSWFVPAVVKVSGSWLLSLELAKPRSKQFWRGRQSLWIRMRTMATGLFFRALPDKTLTVTVRG